MNLSIPQLERDTWELFAELAERNNGIYGGCWCTPGGQSVAWLATGLVRVAKFDDLVG